MEQQIVEAAEELFLNKGFSLTSTTEIARKAGCNQTLVHYYFRTKENLFQAIFESKFKIFISRFQIIGDMDLGFQEKLAMIIGSHFDLLRENPRLPFFIINELLTNEKRLKMIKETFTPVLSPIFRQFEKDFKEAVKKGEIKDMDLFDLLLSMLSLNATLFLVNPIIKTVLNLSDGEFQEFAKKRKSQNIEMILNNLKPI